MSDDDTVGNAANDMDSVGSFAAFLMHQLNEAVSEEGMHWRDAVFAAGMALSAFAEVVVLKAADDSAENLSEVRARFEATLAKARAVRVIMKAVSQEEFDAMGEADEAGKAGKAGLH